MPLGLVPLLCLLTAGTMVGPRPSDPVDTERDGVGAVEAPRFPSPNLPRRPLPFYYDLYTFRGPSPGSTAVIAAFAVPVNRLEREHHDGGIRYRFDVSFVLADTAQRTVRRAMDSMYVAVPHALSGEHLLYTQIQLLAPPSVSTLQRVVMTDIALGVPDETGGWKRGDVRLALLPTSQFPGGSFDLYYEIYNLPRNHQYETEVAVEALDDTDKPKDDVAPVVTRFSGIAETHPDGILPELRRVDTSMERGRYRLTVTVKDEATGTSASRSRLLLVRDWAPGVTLVPALPAAVRHRASE
jgi:hypothetical protein